MKKYLLGLLTGICICTIIGIVVAESINSNEVLYDNSNSSSSATDVQEAIDDVYNTLDKVGSGYSLIAHAPEGLSTELVAGLYRYQGVQDASHNVNNYICFGTVNKSTCVGDTDKYMYRIIGINTNGQMKLIKKEALNTAYSWGTNTEWPNGELCIGLNGSYFLENIDYIPNSTWSNKIALSEWHYLKTTDYNSTTIASRELEAPITQQKIGLLYLHDLVYSINPASYNGSWIYLSNNDSNTPRVNEWLITGSNNVNSWVANPTYSVYTNGTNNLSSVRPVFFLNSSERIVSGSGTITDPYILS